MPLCWKSITAICEELFNYMVNNYGIMIINDNIPHFSIRNARPDITDDDIQYIYDNCIVDIKKKIVEWICNEFEEKSLFNRNNWKPFRDQHDFMTPYMGYKYIFFYDKYYFQLIIDECCEDDNCHCDMSVPTTHFALALYGWKVDGNDKIQPDNICTISVDNIVPEWYWKIY